MHRHEVGRVRSKVVSHYHVEEDAALGNHYSAPYINDDLEYCTLNFTSWNLV